MTLQYFHSHVHFSHSTDSEQLNVRAQIALLSVSEIMKNASVQSTQVVQFV